MSHECVTIVADFLSDQEYGVNVLLPLLPHDPWIEPPPEITVADECSNDQVAKRLVPKGVDLALLVMMADDATFDGTPERTGNDNRTLSGNVEVMILYAVRQTTEGKKAVRYLKDVLRAVRNSLVLLNDPANATRRTRNGVALKPATGFRQVALNREQGDALFTSGIVASYATRETVALSTP